MFKVLLLPTCAVTDLMISYVLFIQSFRLNLDSFPESPDFSDLFLDLNSP